MKKLIIFGNSLMAEVAHYYFEKFSNYEVICFSADRKFIKKKFLNKKKIIPTNELLNINKKDNELFVAIGYSKMNSIRENFFKFFKSKGFKIANFIHPNANVYSSNIGVNNFIMENVCLNPYSKIGDNNIIWSSSILGHHSNLGSNNFLSGNSIISGRCNIKNNCFFGVNSSVKDGVEIKDKCFIDANEYVSQNLKEKMFYNKKVNPKNILKTKDIFDVK